MRLTDIFIRQTVLFYVGSQLLTHIDFKIDWIEFNQRESDLKKKGIKRSAIVEACLKEELFKTFKRDAIGSISCDV